MTSRELFIKTAMGEQKAFAGVVKAVPQKKWDHQPDPKTRTAKSLAYQLALQPRVMANLVKTKKVEMKEVKLNSVAAMVKELNAGFAELKKVVSKIDDKAWETTPVVMKFTGGEWKDTLDMMSWGFLLDMIHHRGQLSTYLRSMGGKVPAIYGPSGDSK